ncbi:AraC family transcriptional regulator [Rhizobium mesosinicum]|uniref:AraC family transcriptional regulator n=1 Tax=Rhizobium mesosinicum TaxID=335017 RepID=A0ABS7GYU4_9HYPH|nr:AraC family transcriptional regulator [Rhizobium mesosinicum]MBW9055007.1 AraC family transcriptional regulator [Rhizobium mesosinicum]
MAISQFRMLRSSVPGVEAVAATSGHRFARHTHEQFGIGLIFSGAQKSLSGRGMVEAEAGDLITVNPNEVHDGAPIGEARSWRILYFDPAVMEGLAREIAGGGTNRSEIPRPVIHDGLLADRFRVLFSAVTGDEERMRCEELFLSVIADALRETAMREGPAMAPHSIVHARSMIDDDPAAEISLADLARESGLSRFQVLRAFARATGFTPHAYHVQARVHLARRLIAGGATLAEAAVESGFADQSHMTRAFVSRYGLTPGTYARGHS